MASFVDDEGANLTLKALLAESPNEILAVRAERGLLEETRNETMILDIIDVLLLERSFSAAVPHPELVLDLGHLVQGVLLVSHDDGPLFPCLDLKHSQIHNYDETHYWFAVFTLVKILSCFMLYFSDGFFFVAISTQVTLLLRIHAHRGLLGTRPPMEPQQTNKNH